MGKWLMICIWFVYGFEYGKMVYESRMLSKGSRFTLGVWGLRACSLDVVFTVATVRNRSQPFAAVRSRPQPFAWRPYGRAYGEFCNSGHFWRFQSSRSLVSRGRRGTLWLSNMFHNMSKIFKNRFVFRRCVPVFVAGAALWQPPSSFRVAGAAL